MSKRALIILGVIVLVGTWAFVTGYEFLEKENALWQQRVKAAKEEQQRCAARYSKYQNFDQFRTSIRLPYTSDLPLDRWMQQFNSLRAGMSEQEVEIVMGAPDYARCDLSEKGDRFVGSTWQYEVAVPQDVNNDSQNSVIRIVFNPVGKLADKNAMNMQPKPSSTPSAVQAATPNSTATPVASPQSSPAVASPTATPAPQSPVATPTASPQQAAPSGTATPAALASPTPQ
ncbi:MAG TPA: hypothetical protein VFP71_11010 [Candidatus Angelobacter sp.]|nr:hypothetical protein [Candidatus Angelobacter sp.]